MNEKTAELDPKLEPEEEVVVPTGDEDQPVASVRQEDALKSIYKKSRKDRSLVTREDQDENPDAEMIAKMVAESQNEGEFEHAHSDAIDLDSRPERMSNEEIHAEEPGVNDEVDEDVDYVPSPPDHTVEEPEIPVAEAKDEIIEEKPKDNLGYDVNNGKVKAVIEGVEYEVPVEDVESAGGIRQYQMNRAANIRFQKAATFAKALQKEREELAKQPQSDSSADGDLPVKDDLSSEAELVRSYREKVLDAALDGTEADVDAAIADLIAKAKTAEPSQAQNSDNGGPVSDRVVNEYEVDYKLDRANANRMLSDQYADVMDNPDLRKIAHSKYLELQADPTSAGRTAVEMAREAGNFVRRLRNAPAPQASTHESELEARRVKKRVLPQSSEARTRHTPLETKKPRSNKDFIRDLQRKQGQRR
ncbi:MAG: hypothetical protein ACYTFK_11600 [Planctomycetota bacterium]|jgi:hypothetical protein